MNMLRLFLTSLFFIISICSSSILNAQDFLAPIDLEKAILKINIKPLAAPSDSERIKASYEIQDLLLEGLLNPISYNYPFDSLRYSTIAIASHKDADARIFTFNTILLNGKFMHFGVIQQRIKKQVKTFILLDTSENLPKDCEDETFTINKWPGALYYQMQPYKFQGKNLILLMGFDGHNSNSNRSFLDVLYFEDGEPLFGFPLFRDNEEDPSSSNRVVFEYHKSAQMVLRYQPEEKIIVLDHLGPAYEKVRGNKAYYIPTGDYDGYPLTGKSLIKKSLTTMAFAQDPKPLDPKLLPLPEDLQPKSPEDKSKDKSIETKKSSDEPESDSEPAEKKSPVKPKLEKPKVEKNPEQKTEKKKPAKKSDDDDDDDDDDEDEDN
jgi:hypothetical protein